MKQFLEFLVSRCTQILSKSLSSPLVEIVEEIEEKEEEIGSSKEVEQFPAPPIPKWEFVTTLSCLIILRERISSGLIMARSLDSQTFPAPPMLVEKTPEDQVTVIHDAIGMGITFKALRKLPAPPIPVLRHF